MPSRSRMRNRGAASHGHASRSCWAVQPAVGCAVTLTCTIRRRSWARTTNTKSTRKVAVGTVKKSMDASWDTWLARNARQVRDGGFRGRRPRYFATVAWEMSNPELPQLAVNTGRAPERVGRLHLADQVTEVWQRRPAARGLGVVTSSASRGRSPAGASARRCPVRRSAPRAAIRTMPETARPRGVGRCDTDGADVAPGDEARRVDAAGPGSPRRVRHVSGS